MTVTEFETVLVDVEQGVVRITLNRPDALNAWIPQLGRELKTALDQAAADPDVRAVVLSGAGRGFSSGADLKGGFTSTPEGKPDVLTPLREVYNPLLLTVRELPKPVVAAVRGSAVGIGASLALACDLIVASESAYFLMAFANIGLALDGGASPLLIGRVGYSRATEIAMLAERIPAADALAWGLVNRVVPDVELAGEAGRIASQLASGPPGSYATIKETLNAAAFPRFAELLELEAVRQQERANSADFTEGVMAFVEKRAPNFTGQ
jgi:2-(1,2-epoxy-1,2-dihydrophenyl)acetyl-CoA isomerase